MKTTAKVVSAAPRDAFVPTALPPSARGDSSGNRGVKTKQRGAWGLGEPGVNSRAEAGVMPAGSRVGSSCAGSSSRATSVMMKAFRLRAVQLWSHSTPDRHYAAEDRNDWHCSTWALQHPAAQQCTCGTVNIVYVHANTPSKGRWGHRRTSCFETLVLGSHIRCHQQPSGALALCQTISVPRRACSNLVACFPYIATPSHRFRCRSEMYRV